MRFSVLALAYDGTIADEGGLDPEVQQAIHEVRAHGVTVVIVTWRILDDLRQVLGDLRLVDAVVAENGAVIAFPDSGRSVILARPASEPLLQEIRQRGIAARVGACVLETTADPAHEVLDVVRQLELPLVLLFSRERLMVLPQAVSKATGLREALAVLRLSTHNAIGIGAAVMGRNVLVAGDPRSGKSRVSGLLCEQLILARYCVCVIDPEGDYQTLEALPGVRTLGGLSTPPSPAEVVHALRYPDVSVLIDLSMVPHAEKVAYLDAVLPALRACRARTGLPHHIIVDEAHYFLHGPQVTALVDLAMGGYTLVTYRASSLAPAVRQAAEAMVVTRTTDDREAAALVQTCGQGEMGHWQRLLATLTVGEAALLPTGTDAGGRLQRFRLAARLTSHVRHRHKYLDVPVPAPLAFYFPGLGGPGGQHVRTLTEFMTLVVQAPCEALDGHLRHHDVSRWIRDVYGDRTLATELALLEDAYAQGRRLDVNDALAQRIHGATHSAATWT